MEIEETNDNIPVTSEKILLYPRNVDMYHLFLILTIAHRKFMFSTLALPRSDIRSAAQGHSLSPTSLSSRFTYFITSTVQHMGICDNPDKRKSSLT